MVFRTAGAIARAPVSALSVWCGALVLLAVAGAPDDAGARGTPSTPGTAPAAVALAPRPPAPGIYRLADLNRIDAARLDRATTYLLQPVDPLDNHGPHLPAGTDPLLSGALTEALATRLRSARPDWSVVILPALPIGSGLVGELGGIYMHTSALGVHESDLRRFVASWALHPGESGFPNLFFVSVHPDPQHQRALNDVSDLFYGNYGMVGGSVFSFVLGDSAWRARATDLGERHVGRVPEADPMFQFYGGLAETSLMLHLMPERVDPSYATLEMVGASSWSDLTRLVRAYGWLGYIGNPAAATAEYGAALWESLVEASAAFVMEIGDGVSTQGRPRLEDALYEDFDLRDSIRAGRRLYERYRQRQDTFFQRQTAAEKEKYGDRAVER